VAARRQAHGARRGETQGAFVLVLLYLLLLCSGALHHSLLLRGGRSWSRHESPMISLQHSQRISAPERSAFACRTRAAPPRAAAPSSEGLARKDSAAQLQGLQSGARGGRNQSSTRSREAGSRWCAARGIAAAAAGAARRSTAGRRAGSRTSGLARVAERGRPARGTVAGQAAEHIAHLRKSDSQRVCSVCQPDLCCFEVTVAVDSSCAFALRLLRTVTEGGRDGLL